MTALEISSRHERDLLDDHPSLSASLEDFEHHGTFSDHYAHPRAPLPRLPSHHSGFARSDDGASSLHSLSHSDSGSAFFPPGERRYLPGSASASTSGILGWSTHRPYRQETRSPSLMASRASLPRPRSATSPDKTGRGAKAAWRQRSPDEDIEDGPEDLEEEEEDDDDERDEMDETTMAARVRLPTDSPLKRSPSPSPAPDRGHGGAEDGPPLERSSHDASVDRRSPRRASPNRPTSPTDRTSPTSPTSPADPKNFFRFAVRAEVQHRAEPFEAIIHYVRRQIQAVTRSPTSIVGAAVAALLALALWRLLVHPPPSPPAPDLVKVAGLARSFEPLILYSENGMRQIGDLQETGIAVWDLSESVRSTNMTSAATIVQELDDLSDNLKDLALELTRFFASVDGDVDGILIVMDWARRELARLSSGPTSIGPGLVLQNVHTALCRVGLLETRDGELTAVGRVVSELFGPSGRQQTRRTLQRTFHEFLAVLEESINAELTHSTALFGLFEAIDTQFHNLARTVIRESDAQEREEGELLASLWTRVLGPNAARLRKFEKNRVLLSTLRSRTVRNKHALRDHNGKLLTLKANLETIRRKLVSPLVRANDSSTLTVEEQIRGLDGTYDLLRGSRERQKARLMETLFGSESRRGAVEDRYPALDPSAHQP